MKLKTERLKEVRNIATNGKPGNGRIGAVKGRSQFQGPNGNWIKRNAATGRFMDQKQAVILTLKGLGKKRGDLV
ncbi:hypothetical protein NSQ59_15920 [Margalitia sp. FSL K6-0131]|uniref:hypothetical protein n=1 Tax=Margalitia sp. FSL K6-0131 TaxID=2954604 RepID=UPI0030F92F32